MGTVFYESVFGFMKGQPTRFFPFCGKVYGHPSILDGTVEEIVADGRRMAALGVDGFDLLAYRYTGDAEKMTAEFLRQVKVPLVMAGRDPAERVAATRTTHGTDVNFGALTRGLFRAMARAGGVRVHLQHEVRGLERLPDGLALASPHQTVGGQIPWT